MIANLIRVLVRHVGLTLTDELNADLVAAGFHSGGVLDAQPAQRDLDCLAGRGAERQGNKQARPGLLVAGVFLVLSKGGARRGERPSTGKERNGQYYETKEDARFHGLQSVRSGRLLSRPRGLERRANKL